MKQFFKGLFTVVLFVAVASAVVVLFIQAYTIFQWHRPNLGTMPGYMAILTGLGFAFFWVNEFKLFKRVKPFNCIKCLTGWASFLLAFCFNVPLYPCYLFIGLLVGGVFERISLRL